LLITWLYLSPAFSFNNPSVSSYTPVATGAGNQNWMIDQKENGDLVIANERGLLIFNGTQWDLYSFSALNAVRVVGDRIYSGGYLSMGYWTQKNTGEYQYTSLVDSSDFMLGIDEQFWAIAANEEGVIFQSLDRLILFEERSAQLHSIPIEGGISKLFVDRGKIYFQSTSKNLYTLEGNELRLFYSKDELPPSVIVSLFSSDFGIILLTAGDGFYRLETSGFVHWSIEDENIFQAGDFYTAIQLRDGRLALGSITRGLFLMDEQGRLLHHLDQGNSLSNNTVLYIYEDKSTNLWLGLDNGLNVVHLSSPYREYIDKEGKIGTVYTSALYDGKLYLGTNQGLFYKKYKSQDEFTLVQNTNGQVWTIMELNGQLFCGHNLGTFLVEGAEATIISDQLGTWKMANYPDRDDLLIQGNYNGFHLLKKSKGQWSYFRPLGEFGHSARQFYILGQYLYFYHTTLGFQRYKLTADANFEGQAVDLYKLDNLEPTSLAGLADRIYFSCNEGLFVVDNDMDSLQAIQFDEHQAMNPSKGAGQLIPVSNDKLAFIQSSDLFIFYLNGESLKIKNALFLDEDHYVNKLEYENISQLDSNTYLLGMTNGYLLLDLAKFDLLDHKYEVSLNRIELNRANQSGHMIDLAQQDGFPHDLNNLIFYFNVHKPFKYQSVDFQYKLEGDQSTWSEWSKESQASFYKLKPGPYSFKVRARVGTHLSKNLAAYDFWIKNPWYLTLYAYLSYFLLFIASLFTMNVLYQRVYKKRQATLIRQAEKEMEYIKLKSEQELMKEKNERLRSEIEAKNKELAVTAMSMVKKNEYLIEIREHLKDIEPTSKFKPDLIIRSINREIENEESWEMLKNAFENVDKDFIKKILDRHPQLTPNDLKLCTYLRLNMNSKEIATLLNISVRSMETKRYRLRKKLELSHQTNLVEYILGI
jgi:AraC family chitin signaling transcriptional activator